MFRVEFTTRHTTVHYQGVPVVHLWKTLEYGQKCLDKSDSGKIPHLQP